MENRRRESTGPGHNSAEEVRWPQWILRTHFIDELKDLLDAETQLTETLPKLAPAATSKTLRAAFQKHLKETGGHVTRLNQALRTLGERPSSKTCRAMKGLLEEGNSMLKKTPAGSLRDAVNDYGSAEGRALRNGELRYGCEHTRRS